MTVSEAGAALGRGLSIGLMLRSAAKQRVSKHEAALSFETRSLT